MYEFSKDNYFPIELKSLVPSPSRSYPLFIYLQKNKKFFLRYRSNTEILTSEIQEFTKNGLTHFWCPKEFQPIWNLHKNKTLVQVEQTSRDRAETFENSFYDDAITEATGKSTEPLSVDLSTEEKKKIFHDADRWVLETFGMLVSNDPLKSASALKKCIDYTKKLIEIAKQSVQNNSLFDDLELLFREKSSHSTVTCTLSTMLAAGIGIDDEITLQNIALGALLHDIGLLGESPTTLRTPEVKWSESQFLSVQNHVSHGRKILKQAGLHLTPETAQIIHEHHERFDGSGYPEKLHGENIHELSQIVAMADTIHDMMAGRLDGAKRMPAKALYQFLKRENTSSSLHFNPALFQRVARLLQIAMVLANKDINGN